MGWNQHIMAIYYKWRYHKYLQAGRGGDKKLARLCIAVQSIEGKVNYFVTVNLLTELGV